MKYKTQDVEDIKNPMLDDIIDLYILVKEFLYAVDLFKNDPKNRIHCAKMDTYEGCLIVYCNRIRKLIIALSNDHTVPEITVTLKPESIDGLKRYEEKYYNMLKEIVENALEEKEIEVMAYLFDIIRNFEHYFCTLDEDDVPRETSSE